MMSLLRRIRVRLVAVVAVLLIAATGAYFWFFADDLPDDAAFAVGDRVVSIDELERSVDTLRALYGIEVPTEGEKLDRFRRDSAKAIAVSMVLDRVAAREDVVIADKTARDVLDRYLAEQFGSGQDARDRFVEALGNAGTTEEAVLTEIKRQLATTRLFEEVTGEVSVSDDELREAFEQRKDELGTPERRELFNIVVAEKGEAARILRQLADGAAFTAVARRTSLDDATRADGGRLGIVGRDQLADGYAEAAFAAKQGEVFGPVRTEYGWNVGRVGKTVPAVPAVLTKVEDNLRTILLLEKATAIWRDWVADRIAEASVRYADDYRPERPGEAPDTGKDGLIPPPGEDREAENEGPVEPGN